MRSLRDSNSKLASSASANVVMLNTTRLPLLVGSGGWRLESFLRSPVAGEFADCERVPCGYERVLLRRTSPGTTRGSHRLLPTTSPRNRVAPEAVGSERRMATASVYRLCRRLGVCCADSFLDLGVLTPRSQCRAPGALWHLGLVVGRGGFEPPLTGPEPAVLPLNDLPDGIG